MHEWESQSHVRWECKYHVVIVPKYRRRVLYGKLRRKVGEIIRDLCRQKGVVLVEGLAVSLYLLCGVIFPVDLLPRGLQELALAMPLTWWYESIRRFLLGAGASERLGALSDLQLLGGLALTSLVFVFVSRFGYLALEHKARDSGRIDQTALF